MKTPEENPEITKKNVELLLSTLQEKISSVKRRIEIRNQDAQSYVEKASADYDQVQRKVGAGTTPRWVIWHKLLVTVEANISAAEAAHTTIDKVHTKPYNPPNESYECSGSWDLY